MLFLFASRVICLSTDGELLFESVPLDGIPAGTPVTTSDGQYVLLTHNVNQSKGIFTVLNTQAVSNGQIPILYEYVNETSPFSPIGYYHNPAYGYYDGGEFNTNDLFIWGYDTALGSTQVGPGQMFAFQMPMDPSGTPEVALLGDRDFQSSTAPVLTNSGLSMYWAVTRSEQNCWVGNNDTKREFFNRGRTNKVSFERGDPAFISSRASPSLSHGATVASEQVVFGPGAASEIFRLNYNYTKVLFVNTSFVVSSKVAVSPDNLYIYYATQDAVLAQLDAETLETVWTINLAGPVYADIALNEAGTVLYVSDGNGVVTAYTVASSSAPTPSPTAPGTSDFPSASPTGGGGASSVPTPERAPSAGPPSSSGGGGGGPPTPKTSAAAPGPHHGPTTLASTVVAAATAAVLVAL
jgi:hypothetical protein